MPPSSTGNPAQGDNSLPWYRRRAVHIAAAAVLTIGIGTHLLSGPKKKGPTWSKDQPAPVTAPVAIAPFVQEVVERGEIESSSNIEVRCEVQGRGAAGTAIIEIVPEGKYVQKGDFIVKLDDSALQADLVQQQIGANTSRALMVEAQSDVETAKLALQEYESGTFRQEEQAMESDEFVAKENLRRAEEYLRYSERLASRGYVTEVQLEADRFAVEKARKELDSARTKLEVLNRFTKQKALNKLKSDVETAEARFASRQNSHNLDADKLTLIEAQLSKCVITAPTSGQVVYAAEARNNTGEPLIAEGKLVRERQLIVRLPDPKRMQVTARVNESRVDKVKSDMPVKVRVDAFPGMELFGTVREVGEYPLPNSSPYMTIKEYGTIIEIHDPPDGLRAGMTAQVGIQVHQIDSATQVPLQAVIQRDDRFFTIVNTPDGMIAPQEVKVGLANDKSVIIESGLQAGQQVVLAPTNYEEFVELPEAKEKPIVPLFAAARTNKDNADEPDALPGVRSGGKKLASRALAGGGDDDLPAEPKVKKEKNPAAKKQGGGKNSVLGKP
jgi:RND family efflux transporter MFP subunit